MDEWPRLIERISGWTRSLFGRRSRVTTTAFEIHVDRRGLTVLRLQGRGRSNPAFVSAFRWIDVQSIHAFKRDQVIVDQVCLAFDVGGRADSLCGVALVRSARNRPSWNENQEAAHMTMTHRKPRYLICVKNEGYEASLERRKVYKALPNVKAESHGLVRVIDESGEDYLYPSEFFVQIDVPKEAAPVFAVAQS